MATMAAAWAAVARGTAGVGTGGECWEEAAVPEGRRPGSWVGPTVVAAMVAAGSSEARAAVAPAAVAVVVGTLGSGAGWPVATLAAEAMSAAGAMPEVVVMSAAGARGRR